MSCNVINNIIIINTLLSVLFLKDVFFGGENHSIDQPQSFTCPLCGELGFSDSELRDHVTRLHTDTANLPEVVRESLTF